jgi:hypothetical protein
MSDEELYGKIMTTINEIVHELRQADEAGTA